MHTQTLSLSLTHTCNDPLARSRWREDRRDGGRQTETQTDRDRQRNRQLDRRTHCQLRDHSRPFATDRKTDILPPSPTHTHTRTHAHTHTHTHDRQTDRLSSSSSSKDKPQTRGLPASCSPLRPRTVQRRVLHASCVHSRARRGRHLACPVNTHMHTHINTPQSSMSYINTHTHIPLYKHTHSYIQTLVKNIYINTCEKQHHFQTNLNTEPWFEN